MWLLSPDKHGSLPRDLRKFATRLQEERGGVLEVGKHKGKWFTDVCDTDPEYVEWAADLQTPSGGMKKFTAFAQKRAAEELEQRTTKKQRGDKDKDCCCCVCWSAPVGSPRRPAPSSSRRISNTSTSRVHRSVRIPCPTTDVLW